MGRQKTPAEPLQRMCFQLKIDDINEQCPPSVDILIYHWKKKNGLHLFTFPDYLKIRSNGSYYVGPSEF